jgi:DNA-directed RNA polymerase subunit RPC12/RpoP
MNVVCEKCGREYHNPNIKKVEGNKCIECPSCEHTQTIRPAYLDNIFIEDRSYFKLIPSNYSWENVTFRLEE